MNENGSVDRLFPFNGIVEVFASVAQLVEQAAVNRWVIGSSPIGGAFWARNLIWDCGLFLCLGQKRIPDQNVGRIKERSDAAPAIGSALAMVIQVNCRNGAALGPAYILS